MRWSVGEELTSFTRIRREVSGTKVDQYGYPVEPVPEYLVFPATRDPVPGDVLMTLPEGDRAGSNMIIITETELRTGSDNQGWLPDYVMADGEVWEVREVQHFPRRIPHYEARVMRLKSVASLGFDITLDSGLT